MRLEVRVDLNVPFVEKDDAKALGARWDGQRKLWYAPPGADLANLKRWAPKDLGLVSPDQDIEAGSDRGVSLTELLSRVRAVIDKGLPDAVWVRAEISELRGKNGNLYPSL